MKLIQAPGFYESLTTQTEKLVVGLIEAASAANIAFSANSVGGMFGMYFAAEKPQSYTEMMQCDASKFNTFFHAMLDANVYLAPSAFEAGFVSCST